MTGAQAILTATLVVLLSLTRLSLGARRLPEPLLQITPVGDELSYHGGSVLRGDIRVSIVWYGRFKPAQRAIVVDFILSLTPPPSSTPNAAAPSAAQWWRTIDASYLSKPNTTATRVLLANQATDERYSLGKSLTLAQISQLAAAAAGARAKEAGAGALVLVLTDRDVAVEGFCRARCGLHGAGPASASASSYAYAWVGDAERACPGQCAWPFARPAYGPVTDDNTPLEPPNGDVGADGIVATLASVVAGAVTNPFGDGFYQGDKDAALEACTACAGVFGTGAYPGYAGKVMLDETTGGSYNAVGVNGRKYLLPAVYDPAKSGCSVLV